MSLPDRSAERSEKSHNPGHATPAGLTHDWFGLFRFRSPLLTESRLLSLPVGNEMFHFPTFPPLALCVQARVTGHDSSRVSPFGHPRITARLAAPRGLSQPPTSFIGSWCQGIHRAPLLTWPQRCSRPLCSSQETGGSPDVLAACGVRRIASSYAVVRRNRAQPPQRPKRLPACSGASSGSLRVRPRGDLPCGIVPSGPNSVLDVLVCSISFHA